MIGGRGIRRREMRNLVLNEEAGQTEKMLKLNRGNWGSNGR